MNDLPALFGIEPERKKPLSATVCFKQYLAKGGGHDLKKIDVDALRCKLMGLKNGDHDGPLRGEPFDTEACDPVLLAWKDTWLAGFRNEVERMSLVRALFRYALGSESECRYAYSFCQEA